jgi:hypothetical protein
VQYNQTCSSPVAKRKWEKLISENEIEKVASAVCALLQGNAP